MRVLVAIPLYNEAATAADVLRAIRRWAPPAAEVLVIGDGSTDGSATVWCSDHDPLARMKGMHGVCLRPGSSLLELKVRAYNRTPLPQTFLWWANVATRLHEAYQSFFPPDVYYVADHAKRAMSSYTLCTGSYYGVNYGERKWIAVTSSDNKRAYWSAASVPLMHAADRQDDAMPGGMRRRSE